MSDKNTDGQHRQCLTPETYYSFGMADPKTLVVHVRFPFSIEYWARGTAGIVPEDGYPSDSEKLRCYKLQAEARVKLGDLIHDQMEVVGADAYRVMRELDARLGTNHVEQGISHTQRRTARTA